MTPILGVALGLVHGEPRSVIRASSALALGMLLAVVLSTALGQLVIPFGIDRVEQLPVEMLERTKPTLFDLAVALARGAAGSYARPPRLSATLPGVAIATALMPPLCVVGLGLALGRTDVAGGALLLFAANFVAIVSASLLVVLEPRFRALRRAPTARCTPCGPRDQQNIVATIRSPRSLTYHEAIGMQREVAVQLRKRVALRLLIIPETRLDPLVPPTLTTGPAAIASPGNQRSSRARIGGRPGRRVRWDDSPAHREHCRLQRIRLARG